MDFSNVIFVNADLDRAILSQSNANQATQQATQTDNVVVPVGAAPNSSIIWIIYAVFIGAMWVLIWRPQKKRAKQLSALREGIKVGDSVITSAGMYGKVVDIGTDVFVIEFGTNKGIRIPVSKSDIADVKEPNLTQPKNDTDTAK